jgi:hypothetical protein
MPDAKTLQLHGWALAIASWPVFLWSQIGAGPLDRFGTLRGVDFLQFYASAWLVAHGRSADLYDFKAFAAQLPALVPAAGDLLYLPIYPPQLALLMAPLGALSYVPALLAWSSVSVAAYVSTVALAFRWIPGLQTWRRVGWPLSLGFPPFLLLVAHGQIATIALPLLLLAWVAFHRRRPLLVGLALGSLAFKPTLGVFAMTALFLMPSWRLLAGVVAGIALQGGLVAVTLGTGPLTAYHAVLRELVHAAGQFEPKLWAMHSLRGAAYLAFGESAAGTAVYVVGIGVALWWSRQAWRRHEAPLARFAVLGVAGVLLNPHLYVYDLVLLLVPLGCLTAWLLGRRSAADERIGLVAYSVVWLPLLGPVAMYTRLQLTPAVLLLLLWLMSRASTVPLPDYFPGAANR